MTKNSFTPTMSDVSFGRLLWIHRKYSTATSTADGGAPYYSADWSVTVNIFRFIHFLLTESRFPYTHKHTPTSLPSSPYSEQHSKWFNFCHLNFKPPLYSSGKSTQSFSLQLHGSRFQLVFRGETATLRNKYRRIHNGWWWVFPRLNIPGPRKICVYECLVLLRETGSVSCWWLQNSENRTARLGCIQSTVVGCCLFDCLRIAKDEQHPDEANVGYLNNERNSLHGHPAVHMYLGGYWQGSSSCEAFMVGRIEI